VPCWRASAELLADLGFPLLVGWSRKSRWEPSRAGWRGGACRAVLPSVAAALLAVERGAAVGARA
jgi:hypothetical protein